MVKVNLSLNRWLRGLGLLWGVLLLFWLPIEDVDTRYIMPLAAGLGVLLAIKILTGYKHEPSFTRFVIIGTLSGLVIPLIAVFLIVFKGGLHAHGFSEFTPGQILDILIGIPLWGLIGGGGGLVAAYMDSKSGQAADNS